MGRSRRRGPAISAWVLWACPMISPGSTLESDGQMKLTGIPAEATLITDAR